MYTVCSLWPTVTYFSNYKIVCSKPHGWLNCFSTIWVHIWATSWRTGLLRNVPYPLHSCMAAEQFCTFCARKNGELYKFVCRIFHGASWVTCTLSFLHRPRGDEQLCFPQSEEEPNCFRIIWWSYCKCTNNSKHLADVDIQIPPPLIVMIVCILCAWLWGPP